MRKLLQLSTAQKNTSHRVNVICTIGNLEFVVCVCARSRHIQEFWPAPQVGRTRQRRNWELDDSRCCFCAAAKHNWTIIKSKRWVFNSKTKHHSHFGVIRAWTGNALARLNNLLVAFIIMTIPVYRIAQNLFPSTTISTPFNFEKIS